MVGDRRAKKQRSWAYAERSLKSHGTGAAPEGVSGFCKHLQQRQKELEGFFCLAPS